MYNYALSDYEVKAIHGYAADVPEKTADEAYAVKIYPNPFATSTTFRYALTSDQHVRLSIYNLSGRQISTLVDRQHSAGIYSLTIDAGEMEDGMYLYELKIGSRGYRGKLVRVKY
jgi:hypothetical protein